VVLGLAAGFGDVLSGDSIRLEVLSFTKYIGKSDKECLDT
jgi:hypothetical protein